MKAFTDPQQDTYTEDESYTSADSYNSGIDMTLDDEEGEETDDNQSLEEEGMHSHAVWDNVDGVFRCVEDHYEIVDGECHYCAKPYSLNPPVR